MARPIADRVPERALQRRAVTLAPDEGRVETAQVSGRVLEHRQQTERVDRLSMLHGPLAAPLDQDCVSHQTVGRLADQDLARLGCFFETLGDVDRFSGDEEMTLRGGASDHLTGVDAAPGGPPGAPL